MQAGDVELIAQPGLDHAARFAPLLHRGEEFRFGRRFDRQRRLARPEGDIVAAERGRVFDRERPGAIPVQVLQMPQPEDFDVIQRGRNIDQPEGVQNPTQHRPQSLAQETHPLIPRISAQQVLLVIVALRLGIQLYEELNHFIQ